MENDKASYFNVWAPIVSAVQARVNGANRDGGTSALFTEQPQRTIVVQSGDATIQTRISLAGDVIDVIRGEGSEPEVIEVESKNGYLSFIHDENDRTTDSGRVADMILGSILVP